MIEVTLTTGADRQSTWRRSVVSIAALALSLAGCSDAPDVRDADGTVVNAGQWSVFDLRVGDCLDPDPELAGEASNIGVVPCEQPHAQEVFGIVTHPEGPYPGAGAVSEWADRNCLVELDRAFGLTLDDGLFVSYLLPTFLGWNTNDDRSVVCVLVFPGEEAVTGSVTAEAGGGA